MKVSLPLIAFAAVASVAIITPWLAHQTTALVFNNDGLAAVGLATAGVVAFGAGFLVGNALASRNRGSSRGGSGRSYSGSRRGGYYHYHHGKRSVEEVDVDVGALIGQAFAAMEESDPSDCFRRLICDISADEEFDIYDYSPILNLLEGGPEVDAQLDESAQRYKYKLKIAEKIGNKVKDVAFCESVFACPFSGFQLEGLIHQTEITSQQNHL